MTSHTRTILLLAALSGALICSEHALAGGSSAPVASSDARTDSAGLEAHAQAQIDEAIKLLDASKFEPAIEAAQAAYQRTSEGLGAEHLLTLEALHTLGYVLAEAGQYERAHALASRAYTERLRLLGEADRRTWSSQLSLIGVLGQLMRLRECEQLIRGLLDIQHRVLGTDHPEQAPTYTRLAPLQLRLGKLNEALLSYRKANALFDKDLNAPKTETVPLRYNWVHALFLAGQTAEAVRIGEQTLKDCVASFGENHEACFITANNLAAAHESAGNRRRATVLYEGVARLAPEVLGAKHPTTWRLRFNAAHIHAMDGSAPHLAVLRELVERSIAELSRNSTAVLAGQHLLASALAAHGKVEEALPLFEQVSQGRAALFGRDHPETLYTDTSRAHSLHHAGQRESALSVLDDVVARIEATRELIGLQGADGQREWSTGFLNPYLSRLEMLIESRHVDRAFQAADDLKARQLLERHRTRAIPLHQVLGDTTARELSQAQDFLWDIDAAITATADAKQKEALRIQRQDLSQRLRKLMEDAKRREPRYAALVDRRSSTAEDRVALAPDELYVSFVLLEGLRLAVLSTDSRGRTQAHATAPMPGLVDMVEALHLWSQYPLAPGRPVTDATGRKLRFFRWTADDGHVRWRAITTSKNKDSACTAEQSADEAAFFRRMETSHRVGIARRRGTGSHRAGPPCAPAGASEMAGSEGRRALSTELARVLFGSLAPQLAKSKRMLISPDGPLWLLPWDLVLAEAGWQNHRPYVLAHNLATATHLRKRVATPSQLRGDALFAVGDPAYPQQSLASGLATVNEDLMQRGPMRARAGQRRGESSDAVTWPRLPYTRIEIDEATRLFPKGRTLQLTDKRASVEAVKALSANGRLSDFTHLIFSAHGYFDTSLPAGAGIVLAPDAASPQEPSYLTVTDVSTLRLASRITILSACNSALGNFAAGEGLVGLSYSLQLAGNSTTLATLWPVPDKAAAMFVIEFMRRVRAGRLEAEALAATKRAFAKRGVTDTRLWAAFVLHGY